MNIVADQSTQPFIQTTNSKNHINNSSAVCDISTGYIVNHKTGIQELNDDCLMHIFTYIPRGEHLALEKVCRRWKIISLQSWRTFKKFDFAIKTWGDNYTHAYVSGLISSVFEDVLSRCGSFLTHIDFSERVVNCEELAAEEVSIFAEHCRNLQHIDLRNSDFIEFTYDPEYEKELSKLFLNNQKLRYVRFVYTSITGECLLNLSADSLETLIIIKSFNISPCHFQKAFKKFQKLHTLSLNLCKMQLVKYYGPLVESINLSTKEFSNLKILNFSQNDYIDDEALKIIGMKCDQLGSVNVAHCYKISNDGLINIVTLPKLEHLDISYLPKITDEIFTNISNLRTMICIFCKKVKNPGLCQLIKKSHNLKILDVSGCKKVNNELVKVAIKTTKNRMNNIILEMYVFKTDITFHGMTTQFLKLRRTLKNYQEIY